MEAVKLYNGVEVPILGYGVYQISNDECKRCVLDAINVGYRHIDTAQAYNNEAAVGEAIIESKIGRKEIFITSKVWVSNYGYEACYNSVLKSLEDLKTDYIDLMLLHQPFNDYYGAWRALEDLYQQGKIKAIGISNFSSDRMVDLCGFAKVKPMVNQVETHPFNQQVSAKEWMDRYDVKLESWGPFAEGRNDIFNNELLKEIGSKYNKTPAQVIIRWLIQRGIIVFPKTVKKERMIQNFDVFNFTLSEKDMNKILTLDTKKSLFFSHQDPQTVEWFVSISKNIG